MAHRRAGGDGRAPALEADCASNQVCVTQQPEAGAVRSQDPPPVHTRAMRVRLRVLGVLCGGVAFGVCTRSTAEGTENAEQVMWRTVWRVATDGRPRWRLTARPIKCV